MADITINGVTVDPQAPSLQGLAPFNMGAAPPSNYLLVQTKAPLNAQQRSEISNRGGTILEYVPEATYVISAAPDKLAQIQALPFVDWAGPFLRGFKVDPSLIPAAPERLSLAAAASGPMQVMSNAPAIVDVVFHRDANVAACLTKVAAAAGIDPSGLKPAGRKVRITVPVRQLSTLAAIDEVRHIEEVRPLGLHNNVARELLGIDRPNPGAALPFTGQGQIVAVADTGFDRGSTSNVHPAFTGRVVKLYALGRAQANDPAGHGTHVAGSVLGDANSAVLGVRVRGTAPEAQLVLQSVLDAFGGLGGLPVDLHDLFDPPYTADGARIHTNSWGSTLGDGRYDSNSEEVDDFVYNHRDCVICFSAGNEGQDTDANGNGNGVVDSRSITPPATAKNCITIGASENNRPTFTDTYGAWWPNDFPANPIFSDRMADNPGGMVAFSSRGPTRDLRFKPDVVAPGTFILSARSRDTFDTGWSTSADSLYYYMGGTSMATPLVAGCVALIRQYLLNVRGLSTPSAALIKAILINGAGEIPGQYTPSEAGPIPNHAEGFGRVNMQATIGDGAPQMVLLEDEGNELDTDEEALFAVNVPVGATVLKVTLVWTDPPGDALQSDLDLIVRAAGTERHGNVAANSSQFDRRNNVEQVLWIAPPPGNAQVMVRAHRALPPQSFALVARTA